MARPRGLRDAAVPVLMLQVSHLGEHFGGSTRANTVVAYPGLGRSTVLART